MELQQVSSVALQLKLSLQTKKAENRIIKLVERFSLPLFGEGCEESLVHCVFSYFYILSPGNDAAKRCLFTLFLSSHHHTPFQAVFPAHYCHFLFQLMLPLATVVPLLFAPKL